MKLPVQYVSDATGNPQAVQLPINEWKKLMAKLRKYEQALKLKSDLKEAFDQVTRLQKKGAKKQTLTQFLNEL